jgi:protein TonB
MFAERKYYFTGFYISVFLYALVFVSLAYTIGKSDVFIQRFTSKENFLDIMIVERPKEEPKVVERVTVTTTPKSDGAPATVKTQSAGVQDLFKSVNTTKLTETGTKASTPSRLDGKSTPKQDNASKIVEKLNFKQQRTLEVTSSSSGIYDPFIGKIQDMLDENWQNTAFTTSDAKAEVTIEVDNMGHFSYYIAKLSYNSDFNSKLRGFLDEMKNEVFPPYEGSGKFAMNIIFKDLME